MSDNTVHLDIEGLSDEEIDAAAAAAAAIGAELEELRVTQNAEEILRNAPVVISVLSPFIRMAVEAAAPKVVDFIKRAIGGRKPRTIHLPDVDLYLEWTTETEKVAADAVEAIRTLDAAAFTPGAVLYFDAAAKKWRAR